MASSPADPIQREAGGLLRLARRWLLGWWHVILLGAQILALALSPSSYRRAQRPLLAQHIYVDTAPHLLWFTLIMAIASLIIIRIVVVTAASYQLSAYALEMVVRVLVLELIPMSAALFAAMRATIANGSEIAALRARGDWDALVAAGGEPLSTEVLPRVLAGLFAVVTLAFVSCVLTLFIAYLLVYGFTPWGFASYTHTVGKVFSPPVALIFVLKTFFFGMAVSLIPIASVLHDTRGDAAEPGRARRSRTSAELQALVRMALAVLVIEAASLVGNYY
jgi:phospholipid/cholesterol/gamma-HCH transport system permease protein